jgi:chromosome segregation ATPase
VREELEREHRELLEAWQRLEQLEREHQDLSGVRQRAERSDQERVEAQKRVENLEHERQRLQEELARLQEELLDGREQLLAHGGTEKVEASRPWWRKPLPMIVLFFGIVILWVVSLVVALSVL